VGNATGLGAEARSRRDRIRPLPSACTEHESRSAVTVKPKTGRAEMRFQVIKPRELESDKGCAIWDTISG
jgi:hypothetical protein